MTPSPTESVLLHASAVMLAGRGLLVLGRTGTGKSGLVLQLVLCGAALVADDQVCLTRRGRALVASAPASLSGLVEARGVGLLALPAVPEAPLTLAVDLDSPPAARMPQPATFEQLGVGIELIFGREVPNLVAVLNICLHEGRASLG